MLTDSSEEVTASNIRVAMKAVSCSETSARLRGATPHNVTKRLLSQPVVVRDVPASNWRAEYPAGPCDVTSGI
jgi:hypothetical protein